ncbi:MAG: hypothetical protein EX254_09380, partial [Flavobacteriaceae bacterium]
MKQSIAILFGLIITITTVAQQGINYKAVVKDGNGELVTGQNIDAKLSIMKNETTSIYTEDHTAMTSQDGIVIFNIGEGTNPIGIYADIDWSIDNYLLKVEIDIEQDGTFEYLGNTAFKAVPYALHAAKATSAFEADKVVKLPEPYILGKSSQVSNGTFSFNGKYGWQAAQEMCEASFPGDPNVRAFTIEQISQAIVLGNWDSSNLTNIEDFWFWAITPYAVGSGFGSYQSEAQNLYGLNYDAGDVGNGTRGQIKIDGGSIGNGSNPLNTYLSVQTNIAPGLFYPCMCGTYN